MEQHAINYRGRRLLKRCHNLQCYFSQYTIKKSSTKQKNIFEHCYWGENEVEIYSSLFYYIDF